MHDFGRYDIYTEVAFICIYIYLAVHGKWFSDLYALKFKGDFHVVRSQMST